MNQPNANFLQYMQRMNQAKSFDEMHQIHSKWIKTEEFGMINPEFISLVRLVVDKLSMVVNKMQQANHIISDRPIEVVPPHIIPDFIDINNSTMVEMICVPYIFGMVTIDIFWKIFKVDQSKLSIIGSLPLLEENISLENPEKYGIRGAANEPEKSESKIYFKNADPIDGLFVINRVGFCNDDCWHYIISDSIKTENFTINSKPYLEAMVRQLEGQDVWQDHTLCLIHLYCSDPNDFNQMIHKICEAIENDN